MIVSSRCLTAHQHRFSWRTPCQQQQHPMPYYMELDAMPRSSPNPPFSISYPGCCIATALPNICSPGHPMGCSLLLFESKFAFKIKICFFCENAARRSCEEGSPGPVSSERALTLAVNFFAQERYRSSITCLRADACALSPKVCSNQGQQVIEVNTYRPVSETFGRAKLVRLKFK